MLKTGLKQIESKINNSTNPIKYFFYEDNDDDDLLEIQPNLIPTFSAFLDKLQSIDEITKLPNLKDDDDFDSFAVDFNIQDCRLVWFRNMPRNKLIIKPSGKLLSYKENTFTPINAITFSFDHVTDAVYFQSSDSIIVFNKIDFERIFDFFEYYQEIAKGELNKLDGVLITISNNMDNLDGKVKICKDISDIKEKGGFPPLSKYKKYQEIFKKLTDEGRVLKEKYTSIKIINDKLQISNENQRETLVSIARSDILQEPISGTYYKSLKKLSLEV